MKTKTSVFFDRRQNAIPINFNDRRTAERRIAEEPISPERRRLFSQIRYFDRENINIQVYLQSEGKEIHGHTQNISLGGLLVHSTIALNNGDPTILQFSFGEHACFVNISGQVVFCHLVNDKESGQYVIGIKFTAIRDFEQRILITAFQTLKQSTITQQKSSLRIVASKDTLAQEAANLPNHTFRIGQTAFANLKPTVLTQKDPTSLLNGVSFELTDEQKALQETVRKFTEKEIEPVAGYYDRTGEFPRDIIQKAFELGLLTCYIPEKFGGNGLGIFETALITEELAAGCVGITTSIMVNLLGISPLLIAATESQKEKYLTSYCRQLTLYSFCFTEPDAGSDPSRIATRAELVGDHYILNGSKCFITNGGVSDYYVVFATVDRSIGTKGLTAFLTPSKAEGISIGKTLDKMGQRASNTAEIFFDNVKIPVENRIGKEREGYKIAMLSISRSRINVAAGSVGVARTAMDHAMRYVQKRVQFNQALANFQYVQFRLADMASAIDAARLLAWRAAWVHDKGRRYAKQASMAKDFAGDMVMKATSEALDLLGGYGYSKEFPMEKLMRDAKLMQIYEGPSPVHKTIIYRELANEYGLC